MTLIENLIELHSKQRYISANATQHHERALMILRVALPQSKHFRIVHHGTALEILAGLYAGCDCNPLPQDTRSISRAKQVIPTQTVLFV